MTQFGTDIIISRLDSFMCPLKNSNVQKRIWKTNYTDILKTNLFLFADCRDSEIIITFAKNCSCST